LNYDARTRELEQDRSDVETRRETTGCVIEKRKYAGNRKRQHYIAHGGEFGPVVRDTEE